MVDRRTPISIAEAVEKVMKHKLGGEVELIPLEESQDRFWLKILQLQMMFRILIARHMMDSPSGPGIPLKVP